MSSVTAAEYMKQYNSAQISFSPRLYAVNLVTYMVNTVVVTTMVMFSHSCSDETDVRYARMHFQFSLDISLTINPTLTLLSPL